MSLARTRALSIVLRFCVVNVSRMCVRHKAKMRFSRIPFKIITVILRSPSAWMLVISAYLLVADCSPVPSQQPKYDLTAAAALWMNPCSVDHIYSNATKTKMSLEERLNHLKNITDQIARVLPEVQRIPDDQNKTDWNSKNDDYRFLKPYKRNQTTWDRNLQIYLASVVYLEKWQSDMGGNVATLKAVRQQARSLLCAVQEFRNSSKHRIEKHKAITAEQMEKKIQFHQGHDAAVSMTLHIHFLKCRFECYLQDMDKHVRSMIEKPRPTRKAYSTKKPRRKHKKGQNKRNQLKKNCCFSDNVTKRSTTPKPPLEGKRKINNNNNNNNNNNGKRKINAGQQPNLIQQNQKKHQRKGSNKKQPTQ